MSKNSNYWPWDRLSNTSNYKKCSKWSKMYIITILMNLIQMKTPILKRDNFLKMMIVKVQVPMRMMKKIIFLKNKTTMTQ